MDKWDKTFSKHILIQEYPEENGMKKDIRERIPKDIDILPVLAKDMQTKSGIEKAIGKYLVNYDYHPLFTYATADDEKNFAYQTKTRNKSDMKKIINIAILLLLCQARYSISDSVSLFNLEIFILFENISLFALFNSLILLNT